MEPINRSELDKAILRVPVNVKAALRSNMNVYDVLQVMGNTINDAVNTANQCVEYVDDTSVILAKNEDQRIDQENKRIGQENKRVEEEAKRVTEDGRRTSRANADNMRAMQDHSRAEADHTNAVTDHGAAVLTNANQGLTDTQKENARANIEAAKQSDLTDLAQKVDSLGLGKFYGYFTSSSNLPTGDKNGYAYVGESAPFAIYNFNGTSWADSGTTIDNVNIADNEDLTSVDGKLKLKDRDTTYGMGYVILRKNDNLSTKMVDANTIYEVRYNHDLNGATLTIPANCVLKFEGGKISNGTINGNKTKIVANNIRIFSDNLLLTGTFSANRILLSWWIDTSSSDNTNDVQKALNSISSFDNYVFDFDIDVMVTDLDFTNKYSKRIKFKSYNSTITIYGLDSHGLDISGTTDLIFDNIIFKGDADQSPKCLVYMSRTSLNGDSGRIHFQNCQFSGKCSKVYLYNWSYEENVYDNVDVSMNESNNAPYGFYFTTINTIGLSSKFAGLYTGARPLTHTEIKNSTFKSFVESTPLYFEGGTSSETIAGAININKCYINSKRNNAFYFKDVTHSIQITNCIDESGIDNSSENHPDAQINIELTTISLSGLSIYENVLYGIQEIDYLKVSGMCQRFVGYSNTIYGFVTWNFDTVYGCDYFGLLETEKFIIGTGDSIFIPTTHTNNVITSDGETRVQDGKFHSGLTSPVDSIECGSNALYRNDKYDRYYIGCGYSKFDWREILQYKTIDLFNLPQGTNIESEQIIWSSCPHENGFIGAVCTKSGTLGDTEGSNYPINGVNFSYTKGSTYITVNNTSVLAKGQTIYIDREYVNREIVSVDEQTKKIELNSVISTTSDYTNVQLYYVSPKLVPFGMLNIVSKKADINTEKLLNGFHFFDTDMNKEIFWNGTKWVDCNGTDV